VNIQEILQRHQDTRGRIYIYVVDGRDNKVLVDLYAYSSFFDAGREDICDLLFERVRRETYAALKEIRRADEAGISGSASTIH
jgi:hypothetical protein